jgi:hypothetical protein
MYDTLLASLELRVIEQKLFGIGKVYSITAEIIIGCELHFLSYEIGEVARAARRRGPGRGKEAG